MDSYDEVKVTFRQYYLFVLISDTDYRECRMHYATWSNYLAHDAHLVSQIKAVDFIFDHTYLFKLYKTQVNKNLTNGLLLESVKT